MFEVNVLILSIIDFFLRSSKSTFFGILQYVILPYPLPTKVCSLCVVDACGSRLNVM